MMPKVFILAFAILLTTQEGRSQFKLIDKGRIVFERRINTYAILPAFVIESKLASPAELKSYMQNYRSANPQFWTDSFQLIFDDDRSLYEPIGTVSKFMHGVGIPVSHANRVYNDLSKSEYVAEKYAYNELMLVKDSIRKIKWKLTDETREIAGYECRRANALIMDSIYVVAFYADAIKTKGGPESFTGLPGIILGVILPHHHISYFAARVEVLDSSANTSIFSKDSFQGNAVTQRQFNTAVINFLNKSNLLTRWTQIFMDL